MQGVDKSSFQKTTGNYCLGFCGVRLNHVGGWVVGGLVVGHGSWVVGGGSWVMFV